MISIIITSFREPATIGRAIESILSQDISTPYEVIVACPDEETRSVALQYPCVKHFQDPGKGKSYALNLLFKEVKGDILILTDGDVYLGEGAIQSILNAFQDSSVGCVGGRVIPQDSRLTMFGYWSHLLADVGAHRTRKHRARRNQFFECSGYLFAIRNNILGTIPLDVAEDSIIPYYFYKKGYKIAYAEDARVYVKNPSNFHDWLKQRKRTASAHEKLDVYETEFPRMKSFRNEILEGAIVIWTYPRNIREFWWTGLLCVARLYMWLSLFYDLKLKHRPYTDGWERVETTK